MTITHINMGIAFFLFSTLLLASALRRAPHPRLADMYVATCSGDRNCTESRWTFSEVEVAFYRSEGGVSSYFAYQEMDSMFFIPGDTSNPAATCNVNGTGGVCRYWAPYASPDQPSAGAPFVVFSLDQTYGSRKGWTSTGEATL
ncbi:hypothetical protein M427DRAFT_29765 [Gonapodya prolifera JEL478]|uniref:Uncharacterized protein n=1 Tax=Gonapodya prolifera (strain JEL478) TaxID=1344416 RepID=A0A139AP82_GONPJ|nr:hypothetical protein M427DRAFT_29765 [Gonapodya prolifera JEL478]|eukprot:KXS18454.1 hypothetical protein M427DRAFT_29765 [Gonapodya prolifera JEL478]